MKRILSLIMVVAMLCAVLALVGCGENEIDETTTEATTTEATTTEATTTEATTTEATTTEATTTEATTTEATTTEATTTEATTTEATTTEATTTSATTPTTIASGTTVPLYARFDFGTKTKAEDEGLTSHEYLVSILKYDADYLAVEFTEDTWVLYATQNYVSGLGVDTFALCFENIVTYDFDAELIPGWGSWSSAPFTSANVGKSWVGKHQYMQVRMLNSTNNNMMSIHWMAAKDAAWSTAQIASCMYLQGGAPATAADKKLTAAPATEFETYVYDVNFLGGVCYYKNNHTSYMGWVEAVKSAGTVPNGNNWLWSPSITGIKFHFMGAYGGTSAFTGFADTRANIKQGNRVEVDYVIFGSSVEQLNAYTSYIEDAAK